ncbi:MAG: hypothetical protein RIC30_20255 [Marinoscillum sp.]|uniref:hypothetical protein n=1 Tax=Marinoscillum sp. TaxID=2024838 RepID=UPI0032F2286A
MKRICALVLCVFALNACNQSDPDIDKEEVIDEVEEVEEEEEEEVPTSEPITTNIRAFMFGHSLMVHEPPAIATPSNETTIPHWIHFLSDAAGYDFAANGQYGFLPQHQNTPPISQWGFDHVNSAWDSDLSTFDQANFNTILLTAGNFIQYQPATENYYGENFTPVDVTANIVNWCLGQEEQMTIYIYENWPDMASFLHNDFPPNASEFEAYNDYTRGEFHQWWLDYQDRVREAVPNGDVKMIPVGPILAKLLTDINALSSISMTELYEDDAPHGRPTIYFLASLVTYMSIYGTPAPAKFVVPITVHENVRDNYEVIVSFIWTELEAFDFDDGSSRIW